MAVSNRERVGRAFEALAAGLDGYVQERLPGVGTDNDPAAQLRLVADRWDEAFRDELSRTDRNLVFELRDVRNRWAHNQAFTSDDAYRALDSIERLLVAVGAPQAAEVGQAKDELMRQRFEAEARKGVPAPEAEPTAGLAPWREVAQPHDDVAAGRFALAEFAADLYQVRQGEGRAEYTEPVEFFRRTFLTAGLRRLLADAVERVTGSGGVANRRSADELRRREDALNDRAVPPPVGNRDRTLPRGDPRHAQRARRRRAAGRAACRSRRQPASSRTARD